MSRIRYSRSNITSRRPLEPARSRGMPTHLFFQRLDLAEPPLVALLMGEAGSQKGPHQLPCQLYADHPGPENQNVHGIVLDALMGRVGVVAKAGADTGQLVGRHGGSYSAPADQHAPLHHTCQHRAGQPLGHIRIVHRFQAVGAEILDLVPQRAERGDEVLLERVTRVIGGNGDHHRGVTASCLRASWARAAWTTCSTVKPNFFCSSLSGADAPKVSIPILAPVGPTYRSQPKVPACSTETRAVTSGGRTLSRYDWLCCSNNSHDGMLTTRARMPSALSRSNASTQSDTSLPLESSIRSGFSPSASART